MRLGRSLFRGGTAAVLAATVAFSQGADARWALAIGAGAPLALLLLPHFLRGALEGALTAPAPTPPRNRAIEAMTGEQFEDHVAHIARRCGLPVIMTPRTGDWGVDLIVGARPHRIAVQCKRQARPVGAAAVQEVVAGAPMQDCTATMVVTNHAFTPAAQRLAERHGCVLVDGHHLGDLPRTLRRLNASALEQ
ncbi:restriction endonuclease [Mycobacterium sp. MYCO198283]|uniref:restriction endonuclease n=1 Tax=Mycobacterium sp. MYCO198283 TaxID=2883505 RepID=UPI001E593799|nr:restriction endonuclease [Mycobacterium sp. MYCO198283]MCG5433927.1 restriction endonuclease [Mycobacterium sp. MYCO198283]